MSIAFNRLNPATQLPMWAAPPPQLPINYPSSQAVAKPTYYADYRKYNFGNPVADLPSMAAKLGPVIPVGGIPALPKPVQSLGVQTYTPPKVDPLAAARQILSQLNVKPLMKSTPVVKK